VFAIILGLAVLTESVLLVGYVIAAASLLIIATLLGRIAFRGGSDSPIESPVPRWADSRDREAA